MEIHSFIQFLFGETNYMPSPEDRLENKADVILALTLLTIGTGE